MRSCGGLDGDFASNAKGENSRAVTMSFEILVLVWPLKNSKYSKNLLKRMIMALKGSD